jgi:fibronectin-binding autotransporter adhesin
MFSKCTIMRPSVILLLIITCLEIGNSQVLPPNRYYNPDYMGSFIWDNSENNGVVNNGNGNWNTSSLRWLNTPGGTNKTWISGRSATFGGNPGTGAAGTVSVSGTQSVKSITFNPTPSGNFLIQNGTLQLSGGIIATQQNATISSILVGGGNFLKNGNANLILTGNNTFTGTITISQGGIYLGSSTAAGSTSFQLCDDNTSVSNIEWRWGGGFQPNNNIVVNNKGTGNVLIGAYSSGFYTIHSGNITLNRSVTFYDNSNDRSTFSGLISGNPGLITIDGNGTFNSSIGQIARVTFENSNNSFTGTIIINANKAFQMGNGTNNSIVNVVNNQQIQANGTLLLNAGQNSTARMGALSGAATGICEIHMEVTGPQTLSVGNDNASGLFNGVIRNGVVNQVMNFQKNGNGTQLLSGQNTYTGTTTIDGGTLGGTGTLVNTSSTIVNNGCRIMGGNGIGNAGIFTVRNLTFATNSNAGINVYSNGTTLSRIQVNGTCNLGTTSLINLMEPMPAGTNITIVSSTGAMSGTNPTIGFNNSGRTVTVSRSGNNLNITLI